jgi:hypothetical protein
MEIYGKTSLAIIKRRRQEEEFYGNKIELDLCKTIQARWCPLPSKTYRLKRLVNW